MRSNTVLLLFLFAMTLLFGSSMAKRNGERCTASNGHRGTCQNFNTYNRCLSGFVRMNDRQADSQCDDGYCCTED